MTTHIAADHPELSPLEAGTSQDESGEDYFSNDLSETTSLNSSILDYQYENGLRYHRYRQGSYLMPNDETEQDRLDMMHHIYLLMLEGQLHVVPLDDNPQRILDIGTGTGIWAIDIANQYPSAEVIGTDLSPIQPQWVPPNCRFEVDDAESPWTFEKNSFDFIHSRHLSGALESWPKYISQVYATLKPGGWVQFSEYAAEVTSDDDSYPKECAIRTFLRLLNSAANKTGRVMNVAHTIKGITEKAGFTKVSQKILKLPWAPWPSDPKMKELGKFALLNCETSFEAFGLALLTRVIGMSVDEALKLCQDGRKELRNKRIHIYNFHYIITAQKPLEEEDRD
ncbi:S-adenosyl-L-methionine-dependent methyltransferase [Choiromyces venosus 120613-1]|uniref:S-adenosyl-L-methionine-dependent methyltransferase n=1 Tax=Choiromyces venosus 120613-1 TaxID=1336337 RepID=A0A3N4J909_9PEZI|nr:S-adenosyl-L-methionine-dependent methyltransferase [Choiromyces venosus 120613-1]